MISYELAKQLNNAGFVQRTFQNENAGFARSAYVQGMYTTFDKVKGSVDDIVSIPTLSELILACIEKDDRFRLQSFFSDSDLLWQADNSGNFQTRDDDSKAETGLTPEDASAKLWLIL